jgi:F-type H+/Na+-transporting ATPase subunit alpha
LFQLAWLTAFNAGLFTNLELNELPRYLQKLEIEINATTLSLDSSPAQWKQAVTGWLMLDKSIPS